MRANESSATGRIRRVSGSGRLALTLALALSLMTLPPAAGASATRTHAAHSSHTAQKATARTRAAEMRKVALTLEDALYRLNTNRIDLLYAYLQSVPLTKYEVAQIQANAAAMERVVGRQSASLNLSRAQKLELLRLFASSIDYAHLRVNFTYLSGKPLDILDYKFNSHILVWLEDARGVPLASMRPHPQDLASGILVNYVDSVDIAVRAAYTLEQYHHFVPMPKL